ncbi:MAG: hypothetical protein ACFCU1_12925 [Sumerlaeia bacterium]
MTSQQENNPHPLRARKKGKSVFLFILLLMPAVIVPSLLLGPVSETQTCMITLQNRQANYWCLGGFPLQTKNWQLQNQWPELPYPLHNQSLLPPWPEETPSAYYRSMAQIPQQDPLPNLWETTYRELPFAFVFPVPNKRALNDRSRPLFEVRVTIAKSLTQQDSTTFQRVDQKLREGITVTEIKLRGRQKADAPYDFAGQENARALQNSINTYFAQQPTAPTTKSEFRKILLQSLDAPNTTIDDP